MICVASVPDEIQDEAQENASADEELGLEVARVPVGGKFYIPSTNIIPFSEISGEHMLLFFFVGLLLKYCIPM